MTHGSQPTRFCWAQQLPGVQVICKELLLGESTSVMTASDDDEATGQTCPTRTVARTRGRGRWSLKDGGGSWRSPSVSDNTRLPCLRSIRGKFPFRPVSWCLNILTCSSVTDCDRQSCGQLVRKKNWLRSNPFFTCLPGVSVRTSENGYK